jgi:ribonuclease-3|tara:strand:- start:703 stop:1386 length:684 start_codon:yes stop_codon:yes gene_type:complete
VANSLNQLQQNLGYQFNDGVLLSTALTHRSFSSDHNERFEFLGDSLVNMLIAEMLFEAYPDLPEGKLTQQRAMLVKGKTLAKIGEAFNVGEYLALGAGEIKTGGAQRESILADAIEAIIAAIYLDSDFNHCRITVRQWFEDRVANIDTLGEAKDAKTRLQEVLQANGKPLPVYKTEKVHGEHHQQQFVISCKVALLSKPTQGKAGSKKMAEQIAAENALQAIGEEDE